MKYLKQYESYQKYKIGDYVKLKLIPSYVENIQNIYENLLAQVSNFDTNTETYTFKLYNDYLIYGYTSLVRRKLRPKEIEDYNLKKTANKYNL